MKIRTILVAATLFLAGCLSDPDAPLLDAGGSAVEGETITARLLDAQGTPFSSVAIRLRDGATGVLIGSTSTDDSGHCVLLIPGGTHRVRLEFEDPARPGETIVFLLEFRPGLDTTLVAERWPALRGDIAPPTGWTSIEIRQRELGIAVPVLSDSFLIPHIRPGTWDFVLVADSAGERRRFDLGLTTIVPGNVDHDVLFVVGSPPTVSIEFEDSLERLAAWCLGGSPEDSNRDCLDTAQGDAAWSGTSLRATLLGSVESPRRVRLEVSSLVRATRATSQDTLRFQIRGTGRIAVQAAFGAPDSWDRGPLVGTVATAIWRRVEIPLSQLLPAGQSTGSLVWVEFGADAKAWIVFDHVQVVPGNP